MTKKVIFVNGYDENIRHIMQESGYEVCVYDAPLQKFSEALDREFYYFVCSCGFNEEIYKACMGTATKYVVCFTEEQRILHDTFRQSICPLNCYFLMQSDGMREWEKELFSDAEVKLYQIISELSRVHKMNPKPINSLKQLRDVSEDAKVLKITDSFFSRVEKEKDLVFALRDGLLKRFDDLLSEKTMDAWQEIILWNRKHECRDLMHSCWQFYFLQKAGTIYVEEMREYHKSGDFPFIVSLGSFEELYDTYFRTLLLLRRLEYGVNPEEDGNIRSYIVDRGMSWEFIRCVVENNKIADKEKVYGRLEELLTAYE